MEKITEYAISRKKEVIAPVEFLKSNGIHISPEISMIDYPMDINIGRLTLESPIPVLPKPLSAIYAIAVAYQSGASSIYLAGFDGEGMSESQKIEMNKYLGKISEQLTTVKLVSILETYLAIPTISVYGLT